MATGRTIVETAQYKLGVKAVGGAVDESIDNLMLAELNRMWSLWSAQLDPIYANTIDSLIWTANSASMTIGATGDLAVARPIEIFSFQATVSTRECTLVPISMRDYQQITNKSESNAYPEFYHYEGTYPNGTLYIWKVPPANTTISITSKKALSAFDLVSSLEIPDGYEYALVNNLAVESAPFFGKTANAKVEQAAIISKRAIMNINKQHNETTVNSAVPGLSNYNKNRRYGNY